MGRVHFSKGREKKNPIKMKIYGILEDGKDDRRWKKQVWTKGIRGAQARAGGCNLVLGRQVGLITKVAFEQRHEEGKGLSHVAFLGKSVPGRGNNQFKGPVADACLACQRDSREASVAEMK